VVKVLALDIQIHLCCPFFLKSIILRSIISGTLRGKDSVSKDQLLQILDQIANFLTFLVILNLIPGLLGQTITLCEGQ
jgi:hypothetical protein